MAAPGPILPYYSAALDLLDGTIDLDTDTIKAVLLASGYTPNRSTHTVYADLTDELSTANGYTSGGATVATRGHASLHDRALRRDGRGRERGHADPGVRLWRRGPT